jgi:hypothetical protein
LTTINTLEDLLRAARGNQEFREAFRREILTEELLELPERFAEYTKVTDTHLGNIDKTLATLTENTAAMNRRLNSLEGKVEKNSVDINGLGDMFRAEVKAQSSFRGTYAVDASRKDNREVAWLFAYKHGLRLIKTRQVPDDVLENWLANNVALIESLNLRDRAWRTFPGADLVVEVRDLQASLDSTPAYYITLEASYTVEKKDIVRATDNAKIVREITGLVTYPVVAGVELDDQVSAETQRRLYDDIEQFIEANDADAALWYQLESADLRPPEPR